MDKGLLLAKCRGHWQVLFTQLFMEGLLCIRAVTGAGDRVMKFLLSCSLYSSERKHILIEKETNKIKYVSAMKKNTVR